MRQIDLDASGWTTPSDFYDAILPALGAPSWHGRNLNALVESMIWGEINEIEPPYAVRLHSTQKLPPDVMEEIGWAQEDILKARRDFGSRNGQDVEVTFEIVS